MEEESIAILLGVILVIYYIYNQTNKNTDSNNSGDSLNDYQGGYDGGHNNYDSENIAIVKIQQLLKINLYKQKIKSLCTI